MLINNSYVEFKACSKLNILLTFCLIWFVSSFIAYISYKNNYTNTMFIAIIISITVLLCSVYVYFAFLQKITVYNDKVVIELIERKKIAIKKVFIELRCDQIHSVDAVGKNGTIVINAETGNYQLYYFLNYLEIQNCIRSQCKKFKNK